MKKIFLPSVFYFLLFAIHFSLFCPAASAAEKLELTLSEAINMSLKENLSLAGERINPKIAEADVKFKKGEFDPNIDLNATESYRKSRSASLLLGTEERTANGDISLGGKVNTGTTYELKWANERVRSNSGYLRTNPYYTSDLTLTMTQPLLKGVGKEIQESNLNVAKNNYETSRLSLDDKASGIIADTARAYWDLTFAQNALRVAGFSLELAQKLLDEVKAKIDAGALAAVEVYKAEAEVSLREEALLKAGKMALDAADKLRVIMNLKDWQVELIPVEKMPEPSDIQPIEASIDAALNNRKDYKQAAIAFKNKEILKKYFDNQKYPEFNVIGAVGLNNLSGTYDEALDGLSSRDYYSWRFGLSLRIPIGNSAAEGNYLRAMHEEEKSALALKILEQQITAEVREAWRTVQLASETIKATKKTLMAAEKSFEAEEGRFRVGMATLNDVLKFQEEYAKALSSEKKAEVDYANAIIEIERVKGTLGQ